MAVDKFFSLGVLTFTIHHKQLCCVLYHSHNNLGVLQHPQVPPALQNMNIVPKIHLILPQAYISRTTEQWTICFTPMYTGSEVSCPTMLLSHKAKHKKIELIDPVKVDLVASLQLSVKTVTKRMWQECHCQHKWYVGNKASYLLAIWHTHLYSWCNAAI